MVGSFSGFTSSRPHNFSNLFADGHLPSNFFILKHINNSIAQKAAF
jgi:hypothetical protein